MCVARLIAHMALGLASYDVTRTYDSLGTWSSLQTSRVKYSLPANILPCPQTPGEAYAHTTSTAVSSSSSTTSSAYQSPLEEEEERCSKGYGMPESGPYVIWYA